MSTGEILHGVPYGVTRYNTIAPQSVVDAMYPVWNKEVDGGVYVGTETLVDGVSLKPFNSVLSFDEFPDPDIVMPHTDPEGVRIVETAGYVGIKGNTVTRLCPVSSVKDCGNCALSWAGMSIEEMSERNCARANTSIAFESMGVKGDARFMLLPTKGDTFIVDKDKFAIEKTGETVMQARLNPAESVVFTESWLREQGLEEFAVAMNGADGSFGVAVMNIKGERVFVPFCSLRGNMGDRGEDKQILRNAINEYLDSLNLSDAERLSVVEDLSVSILIGASATLRNFAHKIQIPEEGSKYCEELTQKYPDLIARAGGKITSAIVLNDQYPGALERGSIFPQLEAELFDAEKDIRKSPITPDNCPGDGQTCHVNYRSETEYALRMQLLEMGLDDSNIHYDDSQAMDPADPANVMASNRAEQNNGVSVNMTNRTINGMIVRL